MNLASSPHRDPPKDFLSEIAAMPSPQVAKSPSLKRPRVDEDVKAAAVAALGVPKETPVEARLARIVLRSADLAKAMTPNRLKTVEEGMRRITKCSPATSSRLAKEFRKIAVGLEDYDPLFSPPSLSRLNQRFDFPGKNWLTPVIRETNRFTDTYFVGVDTTHCAHHLFPTGVIKDHIINPETGISAGESEYHYSTFFPKGKDIEWLTVEILNAEWIRSSNPGKVNKSLCKIVDGDRNFYAIRILTKNGCTIKTCYPLFYASYFKEEGDTISVPDVFSVSKSAVLDFLNREKRGSRLKDRTELTLRSGHLLVNLDGMHGIPAGKKLVHMFIQPSNLS